MTHLSRAEHSLYPDNTARQKTLMVSQSFHGPTSSIHIVAEVSECRIHRVLWLIRFERMEVGTDIPLPVRFFTRISVS